MAKARPSVIKRQREQAKRERKQAKEARRQEDRDGGEDLGLSLDEVEEMKPLNGPVDHYSDDLP